MVSPAPFAPDYYSQIVKQTQMVQPVQSNGANSSPFMNAPSTGYEFGDIISGNNVAKAQAYSNWQNLMFANYLNSLSRYDAQHAHQYEVADLKAAGLNPWLSASAGGASVASLHDTNFEPSVSNGKLVGNVAGVGVAALGLAKLIKVVASLIK